MTYDKRTDNSESYAQNQGPRGRYYGPEHDPLGWAKRSGFHPLKVVTVLGGFAIFPPLGLLTLGYFLWNARHNAYGPAAHAGGWGRSRGCGRMRGPFTGNAAFDEHQVEQINKLREERRAFHEYHAAARAKRDREAYEAFRSAQAQKAEGDESGTKN
jgi:Protein of unknown function (DUF2852)